MTRANQGILATCAVILALGGLAGIPAAPEIKNDFRFSILGDRTGGAGDQVYGRVWREVDLLHPDFVINVGDTIEGGENEKAAAEWKELRPLWERYKRYPLYFTPGNHDVFSAESRLLYEKETGRPVNYSFNYQEAHFTVLDNSRTTILDEGQIAFLVKDLEQNKARHPKFVFFHKPYWIALLRLGSTDFPLHQVARKYGVDYIVSGHAHQFMRMTRDGVVYLAVGSSGGAIQRGTARGQDFAQGWFYHHVWARVKDSTVEMTVKELDGSKGAGRMFRADDWDEKGPKFEVQDPAASDNPRT